MRTGWLAIAIAALAIGGQGRAAFSYCSEPNAPSAALFLRKPMKPFCASSGNCTNTDVELYKMEVERYYRHLREYAEGVDRYYTDAAEYVKCMSKLD